MAAGGEQPGGEDFQAAFWGAKHALGLASMAAFSRATARMEAAGLLRREPHPMDRRLVRLRLTEKGRELEVVIGQEMERLSDRSLAGFAAEERRTFLLTLERLRHNLTDG